jgi:hypothetical protein
VSTEEGGEQGTYQISCRRGGQEHRMKADADPGGKTQTVDADPGLENQQASQVCLFFSDPCLFFNLSCKNKNLISYEKPERSFTLLLPVLVAVVDFLFYYFYEQNDLSFNFV